MSDQGLFLPEHKMQSLGLRKQSNLSYDSQHLDPVEVFQVSISLKPVLQHNTHTPSLNLVAGSSK